MGEVYSAVTPDGRILKFKTTGTTKNTEYSVHGYEVAFSKGKANYNQLDKLKKDIQDHKIDQSKFAEIRKQMRELGIEEDYDNALREIKLGKYLKNRIGDPPADMYDPHAHHILFKKGSENQEELVKEGQEILKKYDIDPIIGLENLVWAPNRVKGQHSTERLQFIVDSLKKADKYGGTREDIIMKLRELGKEAARMKKT